MVTDIDIVFDEKLPKHCYEIVEQLFLNLKTKYPLTFDFKHDLGENVFKQLYVVNWACIFNNKDYINKRCRVIAKTDSVSVVLFVEEELFEQIAIYRNEDLTPTGDLD